jgi:hypothetical protein
METNGSGKFSAIKIPCLERVQLNVFMSAWALASIALLATIPETGAI